MNEHQLREGFGLSSSESAAAALSESERNARIRHLEHQLDTGAVHRKKRNDIRNELFHLRRAADQQAVEEHYERELAERKREQVKRKRELVEQLKKLDTASEQDRRAFHAEVRTLAAIQDKRWTQLLAELAEERMKILEKQVERLKQLLSVEQDELAQQESARQSEATAEAGVRAELSELTQRVLALEQEREAREQQEREREAKEREREAREQHTREQSSKQAEQNVKRELKAELSARREYLEKLLYETPGAERARLAEAENKTLSELSGELESLERQLDAE